MPTPVEHDPIALVCVMLALVAVLMACVACVVAVARRPNITHEEKYITADECECGCCSGRCECGFTATEDDLENPMLNPEDADDPDEQWRKGKPPVEE